MAGRPRKPVALKILEDKTHMTKEEIEEQKAMEIKAPSDKVKPPKYLKKSLKNKFNEIASDLVEIGIMTNLDSDALGRYLYAEDMHQEITKKMKKIDMLEDIDTYDKLTKMQDRYNKQARAAATDLGLTISSRLKLVVPKQKEAPVPKTPEEKLFGGKLG